MIANSGTNIYLPYEEIEVDFSSINKGTLGIHAPNATIKKAIWSDGTAQMRLKKIGEEEIETA